MNITHIIGNGFDINQGIPTSYAHFYEYYLQLVPKGDEPDVVNKFRIKMYQDLLDKRTDLWSDMELALGEVTKGYNTAVDYETVYMDVYNHLMKYIDYAYRYSDVTKFENPEKTIYQDLKKPWLHLVNSDIEAIEKSLKRAPNHQINIISFNYTDTFDRITDFEKKKNSVLGMEPSATYHLGDCIHVHHSLKSKDIILGVDNISQIANSKLANEERIKNLLIKPETNRGLGTLVDRQCKELIAHSDIISIYGASLGATDQSWWKEIGKRMKDNLDVKILYFPYVKDIESIAEVQKINLRIEKKREVMAAIGVDDSVNHSYESRIFINFSNNPDTRCLFSNPNRANLKDNFENVMAVFQKEGKVITPQPTQPKSHLGIDYQILQPPVETLFQPRRYKEKNRLIDLASNPFGNPLSKEIKTIDNK